MPCAVALRLRSVSVSASICISAYLGIAFPAYFAYPLRRIKP